MKKFIEEYFEIKKNNSNIKTELIAGITTFLAAMYIIIINPSILQDTGMPFNGVLTATIILSSFCSIMMGIYAKNPILVAPGMGLNVFFTYSIVIGMNIPWQTALGAIFWSGVLFYLLSVLNIRTYILNAIPKQIRFALSVGIGLFISLIGFVNANFTIHSPATILSINKIDPIIITFLIGLFITSILVIKKIKGALIIGIIFTTIISIPIGRFLGDASQINNGISTLVTWKGLIALPDFSLLFALDLLGSLKFSLFNVIFTYVFTDLFDSISTFVGVAEAGNLIDENGEPRNIKQSLITDSFATGMAGLLGTSPGTAFIESATGIEEGGRTGLTAVIAGLLFLPFMFFSPLLSIVPAIATAPALILVGVFMINPISKINWKNFDDAIPAFFAMVLIPFSYSITQGIIWGLLSWTFIKIIIGKKEEISITLIIIDIFAIIALMIK